jgi:glycine/D-amino acid oxidase-like deaminating enzyme/glycine cleavage system aminomethyltransferase T
MNMNSLPGSARVVVIGGGIGGSSAAYHLAALGVKDVVLLERSMLSSGTTWHSTGNMETYRADPLVFDMVRYAARTYPQLAKDTDREIGWRNVGRVHYTDRDDRWQVMRTLPELGRARGITLELMTPAAVAARLPIIDPAELAGGVWIPSDARVNATDAVQAFAAAARAKGVKIFQDSGVTGIEARDGVVRGVQTDAGRIDCDTVVLAAGLWSRDLARTCGVRLPMYALEHQYIITKPHGMPRDLPLFLSYDDQLYGREEVGGLMIGSLDDDAIALSAAALPQNFSFALLNERWPQFEPYMATAMRRFPVLRTAEIKMLLNGPESFTPDGQMLLGPAPGISGLFTACAFNSNGMALAPAAGRYIAEWIVEGEPSADVAPLDVRRFSPPQAAEGYMRARASEIPGFHCRMHGPDSDYRSARDIRHSPLHEQCAAAGARFVSANGWERPQWFAQRKDAALLDGVAQEVRAALEQVLVVDRSADVKCEAASLAETDGAADGAITGHLDGSHDRIEALVRRLPWRTGFELLTASPEQETRVMEWLRRAERQARGSTRKPDGGAGSWTDLTAGFSMLELHGPARKALLAELLLAADGHDVRIVADATGDTDLLLLPSDGAAHLWQQLWLSGARFGLRCGGHLAQEALRVRRGVPGFGSEATPARQAHELGLAESRPTAPRTHTPRRLVALASPMPYHEFGSREIVIQAGEVVGELTSRVRLPGWPETLALALIDPHRWQEGSALETVAGGKSWPLVPRASTWNEIRPVARTA